MLDRKEISWVQYWKKILRTVLEVNKLALWITIVVKGYQMWKLGLHFWNKNVFEVWPNRIGWKDVIILLFLSNWQNARITCLFVFTCQRIDTVKRLRAQTLILDLLFVVYLPKVAALHLLASALLNEVMSKENDYRTCKRIGKVIKIKTEITRVE